MDPIHKETLNKTRKFFCENLGDFAVLGIILVGDGALSGVQFEKLEKVQ